MPANGVSPTTLPEIANYCREWYETEFVETQLQREYALRDFMHEHAEEVTPFDKIDWKFRRKAATGSVKALPAHASIGYSYDQYDGSYEIRQYEYLSHTKMVWDEGQLKINKENPGKILDKYKIDFSANEEACAEAQEAMYLNPCRSWGDQNDGMNGLLAWFARSMDVSGNFVEQLTPARNGVYRILGGSSTPSPLVGTLADASLLANSRARTLAGTHRGSMGKTLLETIDSAIRDSGFKYLESLKGKKPPEGQMVILWDDIFDRAYDRLLSDLGAPKTRDFYNTGQTYVKGVTTKAVPSFNGHFLRPIIGLKPKNLRIIKMRGMWNWEKQDMFGLQSMATPRRWYGQIRCEDPSTAGFLVHGSFSTGV